MAFMLPLNIINLVAPLMIYRPKCKFLLGVWLFASISTFLLLLKVQPSTMIQLDHALVCEYYVIKLFIVVQSLLPPFFPLYFILALYQLAMVWPCANPATLLAIPLNGG